MSKKSTPKDTLNPKQAAFCVEYMKDSNGSRAAIAAGYAKKGAKGIASNLLTRPHIQAAVDALIKASTAKALITAERIIQELGRIALADPAGAFDENGELLPVKQIPEDLRRAISGVEVEEIWGRGPEKGERLGSLHKIKFWSKTTALDTLTNVLSMINRKMELTGKDGESLTLQVVNYAAPEIPKS